MLPTFLEILRAEPQVRSKLEAPLSELTDSQPPNYGGAEQQLNQLLILENLDEQIKLQPRLAKDFETAISFALRDAYKKKLKIPK